MKRSWIVIPIFLSSFWSALAAGANEVKRPYNEIYTKSGEARASYGQFQKHTGVDVLNPKPEVAQDLLGSPLGDSISVFPIPLILPPAEIARINQGVIQRGQVYRELFYDLVMGEQKVLSLPGAPPKEFFEKLFFLEGYGLEFLRGLYKGRPKTDVRFLIGSDLVRDEKGNWVVLEDNLSGSLGGISDVDAIRSAFLQGSGIASTELEPFMVSAVKSFLKDVGCTPERMRINEYKNKKPAYVRNDDEEFFRTQKDLLEMGGTHFEGSDARGLESKICYVNHYQMDQQPHSIFLNFLKAAQAGKIEFFATPGFEAFSHKTLLPYVDLLSRFYLGEDLTLKSPETRLLDAQTLKALKPGSMEDEHDVVIKRGDGSQGKSVYMLKDMDEAAWSSLKDVIGEVDDWFTLRGFINQSEFIAQKRVEASYIPLSPSNAYMNVNVDLRPMVYIGPESVVAHPVPWGRANAKFTGRLNNVSQGAMELVVLSGCEKMLKAF